VKVAKTRAVHCAKQPKNGVKFLHAGKASSLAQKAMKRVMFAICSFFRVCIVAVTLYCTEQGLVGVHRYFFFARALYFA